MTVCVYHNGVLAGDSLITTGNIASSGPLTKIGMIYEDLVTHERATDPTELKYPVEFAMYALAGCIRQFSRFLRWFISVDHAGVDHNELNPIKDPENIEDDIEVMLIFKNLNIVRSYDSKYTQDLFVDIPKDGSVHVIGSGGTAAQAIITYDKQADLTQVIEAVTKVDIYCGGSVSHLSFSVDPCYDAVQLKKDELEYNSKVSRQVISQLKEAGVEVDDNTFEDVQEPVITPTIRHKIFFF